MLHVKGCHECMGDIMSTLGDIMSTLGNVQYFWGHHDSCGIS